MAEDIIFRNATEADVEAVCDIAVSQWSPIYDGYADRLGRELYELVTEAGPLERKRAVIRECALDFEHCIVAEMDGRVVGFAHFLIESANGRPIGVLGNNAVSGECRGRGIAGRLYDIIFDKMKAIGCVAVKVHTGLDDGHAPARRAYEKMGFEKNLPSVVYYKKL